MKKVLFLSKGEDAPSTRYRALAFFDALKEAGFSPSHQSTRGDLKQKFKLLQQVSEADVVVINRRTFPTIYTYLLRKSAKVLIFDFDDAVFTGSKGEKGNRRRRFINMVAHCDVVWAGNGYLAEMAKQHNKNVIEVPTAVDTERYQNTAEPLKTSVPTLVWIGSSSTKKYLQLVIPILDELAGEVEFQLKIIADFSVETKKLKVIPVQWQADTEISEIKSCHIGIAPMIDDAWTRGKCALKVLQYFAAGLPCVSSAAGANEVILNASGAGFLASDAETWKTAIKTLIEQPEKAGQLGQQGRTFCQQFYSQQAVVTTIIDSLNKYS